MGRAYIIAAQVHGLYGGGGTGREQMLECTPIKRSFNLEISCSHVIACKEKKEGTKSLLNPCPAKISGEISANFSATSVQHELSCFLKHDNQHIYSC